MTGSGLSDVLLEAGLSFSRSLDGVLKGKNYDRAMQFQKALLEGTAQLLLEKYQEISQTEPASLPEDSQRKLSDLAHNPGVESHS